jgi:plastocyanin
MNTLSLWPALVYFLSSRDITYYAHSFLGCFDVRSGFRKEFPLKRLLACITMLAALALGACGSPPNATQATTPAEQPDVSATQPPAGGESEVTIGDNTFTPKELRVSVGTTVVWTHSGERPHTVTADDDSFTSDTLNNGATFQQTFDTPGTFPYYCQFHGGKGGEGMAGVITVTDRAATAPTPTFEPVTDTEPTVGAVQPGTSDEAETGKEFIMKFETVDDKRLAAISLDLTEIDTPPEGKAYAVWLIDNDGKYVLLGPAKPGQVFTYVDPAGENLVGKTTGAMVSLEAPANAESKSLVAPTDLQFVGVIPAAIVSDVRQLVVAAEDTPSHIGYDLGLREQAALAADHAQLALDGIAKGDQYVGRLHAEHVLNILNGQNSDEFGDLDGNGEAQNPGDGYGVLPYTYNVTEIVDRIAAIPDLSDYIHDAAAGMGICARNISDTWGPQVSEHSKAILNAADAAAAEGSALELVKVASPIAVGVDANGNGEIEAIAGECGAEQLYQLSHALFNIRLIHQTTPPTPAAPPASTPAAPPTPTPTTSSEPYVEIGDNTFTPQELTIPVGTTVVWEHHGQRPHTVTADDGSFTSDTLNNGATFEQTFDTPGIYPYYCEFHGNPGGISMAGVIRVSDSS